MAAFGTAVRIPALGDDGLAGQNFQYAQCIYAVGTTDGVLASSSDSPADLIGDTVEANLDLFNIEAGADDFIWVMKVCPVVVTAFNVNVNIVSIGDTDSTLGWGSEAAIGATSTDQGFLTPDSDDFGALTYFHGAGRYYVSSSGAIEMVIDTADPTVGRLAVFVAYARVNRGGA